MGRLWAHQAEELLPTWQKVICRRGRSISAWAGTMPMVTQATNSTRKSRQHHAAGQPFDGPVGRASRPTLLRGSPRA